MTDIELVLREIRELRLAVEGKAYRDRLLVQLADLTGLGPTWACAQRVSLIVQGASAAPDGGGAIAKLLSADRKCPLSARQIFRVLKDEIERGVTDKSAALCQWSSNVHHEDLKSD